MLACKIFLSLVSIIRIILKPKGLEESNQLQGTKRTNLFSAIFTRSWTILLPIQCRWRTDWTDTEWEPRNQLSAAISCWQSSVKRLRPGKIRFREHHRYIRIPSIGRKGLLIARHCPSTRLRSNFTIRDRKSFILFSRIVQDNPFFPNKIISPFCFSIYILSGDCLNGS